MKVIYPVLCLLVLIGQSCNNQEPASTAGKDSLAVDTGTIPPPVPDTRCYAWRSGRDTVWLKVNFADTIATGELVYDFFEKDRNQGTIDGRLAGDTLLADYTFRSEGATSIRQVAFIISDTSALEGYGPVNEKNGRQFFRELKKLKFAGIGLKREPCQ